MKLLFSRIALPVLVIALATMACGLGGNSTPPGEVNGAVPGPGQSSSGSGASSSYGNVPLPADTVDLQAGQVYKVGQAVKDPKDGVIFQVTGMHFDNTLPGLGAGETYLMIEMTLGNASSQTFSASSLGSFMVKAKSDGKAYGEGHVLALLAAQAIPSNAGMDVDVAPGTGYHGILPVVISATATGLVLQFTPLTAGDTMGQTFKVDLGK